MARLVLESGEDSGQSIEIGEIAVIGRLASCDVPIKDRKSSRNNTKVFLESGVYFVEDMGSSNGTLLNEKKITKSPLRNGDRITIGTTTIRFEAGTPPTVSVKPGQPSAAPATPKAPPPAARRPSEALKARPQQEPSARTATPPAQPAASGPPSGRVSQTPKSAVGAGQPGPGLRERVASMETPPAGIKAPDKPSAPAPANQRSRLASIETPPAGIKSPTGAAAAADDVEDGADAVEELDIGAEEESPKAGLPISAAPAAPEKPKPQVQFRVPIRSSAGGRGGSLLSQDVSQRSVGFRAAVYLGAVAIMALIGYMAFKLASGAF